MDFVPFLSFLSESPVPFQRQVDLRVKGRTFPIRVSIGQFYESGTFFVLDHEAYRVVEEGTQYLRSTGFLRRYQTIGYPEAYETYVEYRVIDETGMDLLRLLLEEIPVGAQRMVEKGFVSKRCKDLPYELVDLLHDFIGPVVKRTQKY